jgi:hypothetical protein
MSNPDTHQRAPAHSIRAEPDPLPAIGIRQSASAEAAADKWEIGNASTCNPRCERYAACRPDKPGWVQKKQAAANMATTLSALRQRAARVGYASPARTAMPRSDQPKLCLDAAYFALQRRGKKRKR